MPRLPALLLGFSASLALLATPPRPGASKAI